MDGIVRFDTPRLVRESPRLLERITRGRLKRLKRLRRLGRLGIRFRLQVVEGREATTGAPLTILHAGPGPIAPYLLELTFGDTYHVREAGRAWNWNLSDAIRRRGRGCALAFVEISKSDPKPLRTLEGFRIPLWVVGECDIPCATSILRSTSVRSDLDRVRRNELRFEFTRDERHFDDFYENMYVPHAKRSHGEAAHIGTYGQVKKHFANGELMLIRKEDRAIAGVLIEYKDDMPHLKTLGARDGDRDYIRCGGLSALYFFALSALGEQGHTKVGLGASRAFLDDGVLCYKRKWGHRITGTRKQSLVLQILEDSPGSAAFLEAHPFIFRKDGALVAAVFSASDRAASTKDLQRIENRYAYSGLAGVEFFSALGVGHPHG